MIRRIIAVIGLSGCLATGSQAAVFTIGPGDAEGFERALVEAAANDESDVIELAPDSVYVISATQKLEGRLVINGNGSEINSPPDEFAGLRAPAGAVVTINDVHFRNIRARGVSALSNGGTLRLVRTTLSNSYGEYCGRAVCQIGWALSNGFDSKLILENTTIASNGKAVTNTGDLTLINSTIAQNVIGLSTQGRVTAMNTIIAGNAGAGGRDCNIQQMESMESLGHNLDSDGSCGFNKPTDLPDTNPRLGGFGDHGGQVPTVALRPGSPAVDAGNVDGCSLVDGRGYVRAYGPNWDCDIGAYDLGGRTSDIEPALTATWFDVREDGHYFNVQVLDSNRNEVLVHWNTFDADGNHLWLQGLGQIQGHRVDMVLLKYSGMRYPVFDPADRTFEPWGTLTLAFSSCWRAVALYDPLDPAFGPSAESRLIRLTATAGLSCR